MSKLSRFFQKIFGLNSSVENMGMIGSLANGSSVKSKDPEDIQSLSRFETGLSAIRSGVSLAREDFNSMNFLFFRQLAYIFQQGIPEYNNETIYYENSIVSNNGALYVSKTDNNVGNLITNQTHWKFLITIHDLTEKQSATNNDIILMQDSNDNFKSKKVSHRYLRKQFLDAYVFSNLTKTSIPSNNQEGWTALAARSNLVVAVGDSGTVNSNLNRVATSPDGITWTVRTASAVKSWIGIAYNGTTFAAVASGSSNQEVMTSTDGTSWTTRTTPISSNWKSIAFGGGYFVAAGTSFNGGTFSLMYSSDGTTWTGINVGSLDFTNVSYHNGYFYASGYNGIYRSTDVATWPANVGTWTQVLSSGREWTKVIFGNNIFVSLCFGGSVSNRLATSTDGINWTLRDCPTDGQWKGLHFYDNVFIASGYMDNEKSALMYSYDGINWKVIHTQPNYLFSASIYAFNRFIFASTRNTDITGHVTYTDNVDYLLQG